MQTRMLTVQSVVHSPLRRSSRIKKNKYSPGSESDSSMSSVQTTQSTRIRTAAMDSTTSDTKRLRTRKNSVSSEIEIDIDVPRTPGKRTKRQSSGSASLVSTPTRINTRATSKRFIRAGSEATSPLPATRITRRTRAKSTELESSTKSKSRSSSPAKTHRQASVLPSGSQIKQQIELDDRIPYIRLDSTIVETDEVSNSGNSDSSPRQSLYQRLHQINRKLQSMIKDEVEDHSNEKIETSTDLSKSSETLQLSEKKDETQTEDITGETAENTENTFDEVQKKFEKTPTSNKSTNEGFSAHSSPNDENFAKENAEIVENLSDIDKSLLDMRDTTKETEVMSKDLSDTSIEEQKSDKENHTLNIISDVAEKIMQSKATPNKSFTSPSMNKSLNEETKSMKIENLKIIDGVTNKDEISKIENANTSTYNEDAMEVINKLDKTDKKECTVTDDKNSNKIKSNKVDKTLRLSADLMSKQISDSNEIKLVLEKQSPHRNDNEVSPNVAHSKSNQSVNLQISADSAIVIDKQSALTQDEIIDSTDSVEQDQENLLKYDTESTSNILLETNNSTHDDSNDMIIQDNQFTDVTKASKKSTMDILFDKTDSKDVLSEKVKPNLKRKSTDNLEGEKESLQTETTRKDQETVNISDDISDDDDAGINLFQDIPADKWKEKNDVNIDSVQSTSQLVEEVENESEAENCLILINKKAWLAAETIKAVKETESFEYDSDDTVLLKSRLDASQANCDIEKLTAIDELPSDTDLNKTNEKQIKKQKSRTMKRLVSEIDEDIFEYAKDEDNLISQKLTKQRTSLNKSFKGISSSEKKLDDTTASTTKKKLYKKKHSLDQLNESTDDNATESDERNVSIEGCSKKRENTSNRSMDQETKKTIQLYDDESDNSDISTNIVAANLGFKSYSTIANMGSDSDDFNIPNIFTPTKSESSINANSIDSDINREYNLDGTEVKLSDDIAADECRASELEFSDSDDNGSDLAGFIVDDIETENEEEEHDSKEDNDTEVENEEAENDNEEDSKDVDYVVQKEKVEDEKEEANFNTELNIENKNEDNEDVQKKDATDKDRNENTFILMEAVSLYTNTSSKLSKIDENEKKSIDHVSPYKSETETTQNVKMKKSSMNRNDETILEDLVNSDLSIKKKKKKKSLMKENETVLSDTSNLISSSFKKKRMLDPRYSKDVAEQNFSEQSNEFKSSAKSSKSRVLMDFSTPKLNTCKKLELDETFETTPENKCNKSSNKIKATQDISVKDVSKKNLTLNEDISLKKLNDSNKKKISSNFSSILLEKLGETSCSKSSKIELSKTMSINNETPRLKHLKKEKLNESAPTKLKYNTETNSSQKESSAEKNIKEIKIKEKNKAEVPDSIISSNDNIIQSCKKKQKKRKRQELSNKNINDEILSEDITELNVPKRKKIKLIQSTVVEDNICKDTCQINKKKKKKDKIKKDLTDKTLSENAIETNISKKKPVKLAQLSIEDNTREITKQEVLKNHIIREVLFKELMKLKSLKKKKRDKLIQLPIVEDNIRKDVGQINERKKKKKKQDTSEESVVMVKPLSTDVTKIKIPKKKKLAKLTQLSTEDNIREDTCQINKNDKKKKQIKIVENTNVNEHNMLQNIREKRTELSQHKKKNKIINSSELNLLTAKQEQQVKKKIKQQETVESIETLQTEKKKKKKKKEEEEKNTLPVKIPVSKLKSKQILLPNKLRLKKSALGISESKNVFCNTKELDKAIDGTKMCIKESRPKKKRNRSEDVENALYMNVPTKKPKREVKEESKSLPSGLNRLPDDVIENLADVPMKVKKRQKTLRNKKKIVSSTTTSKSKATTADCDNTLNTSDYTTQFHIVNLKETKKQSLKGAAAAISFRQRVLNKNNREPISSYMMFREKMSHAK
ncbi:PREDICTED: uncharacterized protein MAL13P1.304-like [Cyphomyrmex costatus]|uniref:uncharacterized protein MAL13P1.304-like n=1 Tax=Cyphomyrmex costatus TaxID=456900 RepID=UPI0008524029|nr:PREDICTED: uncharacterized protein MAL13P1.304-like [Cyphomyrmex costatus]